MIEHSFILEGLNEAQLKAVEHVKGSVMVIAGAGSGKTKVLTHRIAYTIAGGVDPYRILALTFTNKAAAEMRERIRLLIGDSLSKQVWMGTFHSMFSRILRKEGKVLGYTPNFVIYDTEDSKNLLKQIVKELGLDSKTYTPSLLLGRISQAKSNLISDAHYNANSEIQKADADSGKHFIGKIFKIYNLRLKQADAMDFDDLLYYINVLFRDYPEVLSRYQMHFEYVLVDEYQDTNFAQYMIVKKLVGQHRNLCVVGDDAQSIYGFRGANIENIFNFKRDFPEHHVYKLEQNYRSTGHIVGAANSVISNNQKQIHKEIWTQNEAGVKLNVIRTKSEYEEGRFIAEDIEREIRKKDFEFSDFAILYRTNMQSRPIEEALRRFNLPYRIYGGLAFYKRREIKDILAYFRLTVNPKDEESLRRVINYPQRGIGQTTIEKIIAKAAELQVSLWNIVENPESLDVNLPTKERLKEFTAKIKSFSAMSETMNAYEVGGHIFSASGILKSLEDDVEGKERLDHIQALLDSMQEFCEKDDREEFDPFTGEILENQEPNLSNFLGSISLLTDEDENKTGEDNRIKLMTIHTAKGLEFNHVYISGLEENLFPSALSLGSRADLEEERRLFYVALTRARKQLTITYANSRFKNGSLNFCEVSRFVDEIQPEYLEVQPLKNSLENLPKWQISDKSLSSKPNFKPIQKAAASSTVFAPKATAKTTPSKSYLSEDEIYVGLEVIHDKFGHGEVMALENHDGNARATIAFPNFGTKILLLSFAKLRQG